MATIAQAAQHLDLSERRFRELLDEGVLERCEKGAYDFDVVRRAYIRHLRSEASGRGSKDPTTQHRARKLSAQADREERMNAEALGQLLPRDEVHLAVTAAFARVRSKLLALPTKIAPRVIGIRTIAAIKDLIADHVYEALRELAGTQVQGQDLESAGAAAAPDRDAGGTRGGGGLVADPGAAANAHSEPVGGPRKAAVGRGKRRTR